MFLEIFKNVIGVRVETCTFNIILKIYYKFFFIYLVIEKKTSGTFKIRSVFRAKNIFKAKIRLINSSERLDSLSKLLNRDIDLKEIELDEPKIVI